MSDSIRKVDYFKVGISNKTGEGARVLGALRDEGVNLLAFTGFPRGRRVQLDFVPEDADVFRKAAKRTGLKIAGKKSCFLIQGENRAGAIAAVAAKLAEAGIGIRALDGIDAGGGRYGAILWVESKDIPKAVKALGAS
ncbi:MAG: hypothetical protein A2Z13_09025 [Deltaproteobacteria bacterium RBG_16_64_85]|nr:MAG: hypothetical protein A2Z13_09025 [Deltaproteobacteria bacterium RBG_16_64_85]